MTYPPPRPIRLTVILTDYDGAHAPVTFELQADSQTIGRATVSPAELGDVLGAMVRGWIGLPR